MMMAQTVQTRLGDLRLGSTLEGFSSIVDLMNLHVTANTLFVIHRVN